MDPDPLIARKIFNLLDQDKTMKKGYYIILETIKYCQKIYVPDNIFPIIDLEYLKNPHVIHPMEL